MAEMIWWSFHHYVIVTRKQRERERERERERTCALGVSLFFSFLPSQGWGSPLAGWIFLHFSK
jgi:hypothetical protein